MGYELKEIINRLEGYTIDNYEVVYASKNEDGSWSLRIRKTASEIKQEVAGDDN